MSSELIINYRNYSTRVALMENSSLAEIQIERGSGGNGLSGNIYLGRILRVLPGMQAAFVDIGQEKAAFLYVDDVCNQDLAIARLVGKPERAGYPQLEEITEDSPPPLIEELIREDQDILVQVSKEPIGQKGARITSHVSLPGRRLVLMPTVNHLGISRRIEDENERRRLKDILERIRPQNYGFIARTAAEGAQEAELAADVDFLIKLWAQIAIKAKITSSPGLVHQELDATLRAVRDMFSDQVDRLVIDHKGQYEKIKSFLESLAPKMTKNVELHEDDEPIFQAYNIENDLARALDKKVWLKSGGYIVIESTEALTVVDVNTGRYVGNHNLEETILKTNLEAVREIAYQLRLRNIGGLIVIDFIDMEKEHNRERVSASLKEALKKDRSKTKVLPMSELGLIEMTRKRTRENIDQLLREPCFYCHGHGFLLSRSSVCHQAFLEMETMDLDCSDKKIILTVHPAVREFLLDEERFAVEEMERVLKRNIMIKIDDHLHLEEYRLETDRR